MNYIKQVAKMLGVEVGEKFNIVDRHGNLIKWSPYKLTKDGLVDRDGNYTFAIFGHIISGNCTIQKLPWKPKVGERFYYVEVGGNIITDKFDCFYASRMNLYKMGNCFRSRQEAEKNKEKVVEMYRKIKEQIYEA